MASSSDPKISVTTQTGIDVDEKIEKPIEQYNSDCATTESSKKIADTREVLNRYVSAYSLYQDENETNESFKKNVRNEDGRMNNKPRIVDLESIAMPSWLEAPKSFTLGGRTRDSFRMKNISANDSNIIDTKETTMTMQRKIEHLQSMLQRVEHWESRELPVTLKVEGEKIKEEINRLLELTANEKESVIESIREQKKPQVNNKRKIVVKNGNKKDKQYQRTIIGLKAEVQRQKAIYAREKIKWEREREELQRALLRKNQTDESSTQTSTDLEADVEVFQRLAGKWPKPCKCNSCMSNNKLKLDKRNFKCNQDKISKKTVEYVCNVSNEEFVQRANYEAHNAFSHSTFLPEIAKDDEQRLGRMPARGKTVGNDERQQMVNEDPKKCAELVKMNLQRLKQQEDEELVIRDAAVTSLKVVAEALQDRLHITKPIVSIASSEETNQLDEQMTTSEQKVDEQVVVQDTAETNFEVVIAEALQDTLRCIIKPIGLIASAEPKQPDERMTTSENEETAQDSLNVSKQDDVSTEALPATPIVSEKKTQTEEEILKLNPISAHKKRTLRRRFMSQLFRHECEKNECSIVSMRSYALHADFCTEGIDCNLFVCQSIRDRSKHLRICEDELRCVICQYRIYFDEDRLQDMMDELEKNCPVVNGDMSNLEDNETLVYDMVQLAVNYGLIGYAHRIRNTETGEIDGIYDDESSSEEEEETSDGWELCG